MTLQYYKNPAASRQRGFVEKTIAPHQEPTILAFNPYLPQFTAAWFKVFLDGTPVWHGIDFEGMLFGPGRDSLCGGGDGEMTQCKVHR
mmetsp:Transcript_18559/g.48386  ORF Transcript_18559/g.48386 Transcript_18559/m.48386 type:complete len:88 (+) Transcript_18559:3-266(+)